MTAPWIVDGDIAAAVAPPEDEEFFIYAWGWSKLGQLAFDSPKQGLVLEPQLVPQLEQRAIVAVSCGWGHTAVLTGMFYIDMMHPLSVVMTMCSLV